jgi:transposase-like protein
MELNSVYKRFPKQADCIDFLEQILWPDRAVCPYCKTSFNSAISGTNRYHCNKCNTSFSVTVNTMFHKTKCDLQKWFYTIHLFLSGKKIPARELGVLLDVSKDTAWKIFSKIEIEQLKSPELINTINNQLKS